MKLVARSSCPVCLSNSQQTIYQIPYSSVEMQQYLWEFYSAAGYPEPEKLNEYDFDLVECKNCFMIYQLHIPDHDSLINLYTKWISQDKVFELYEKRRELHLLDRYYLQIRNLIQYFGHRKFKLFDYGFGYCHFLKQASLFGIDVYGSEFNREQIELAKASGVKVINDFDSDDVPKMDVIFCEQVLEHTVQPREIMADIASLAVKGTLLHLSVPDSVNVKAVCNNIDWSKRKGTEDSVNAFAPLEHINSFRHEQLIRLASDFGFQVIDFPEKLCIKLTPVYESGSVKGFASITGLHLKSLIKSLIGYRSPDPKTTDIYFEFSGRQ